MGRERRNNTFQCIFIFYLILGFFFFNREVTNLVRNMKMVGLWHCMDVVVRLGKIKNLGMWRFVRL